MGLGLPRSRWVLRLLLLLLLLLRKLGWLLFELLVPRADLLEQQHVDLLEQVVDALLQLPTLPLTWRRTSCFRRCRRSSSSSSRSSSSSSSSRSK